MKCAMIGMPCTTSSSFLINYVGSVSEGATEAQNAFVFCKLFIGIGQARCNEGKFKALALGQSTSNIQFISKCVDRGPGSCWTGSH